MIILYVAVACLLLAAVVLYEVRIQDLQGKLRAARSLSARYVAEIEALKKH